MAAIAPPHLADVAPRFSFAWNPFGDKKTVMRGSYNIFYTNAINAINNVGQGIQPGAQWQSFSNWTGSFYPNQCGEYSGNCVAFPLSDTTTNKANLTIPPIPANRQPPAANYDPSYAASLQFYYPPAKIRASKLHISDPARIAGQHGPERRLCGHSRNTSGRRSLAPVQPCTGRG